jgi:hypothetical protein
MNGADGGYKIVRDIQNGGTRLCPASPSNLINEFELDAGKETLGDRVVPAITTSAHAASERVPTEQLPVIPIEVPVRRADTSADSAYIQFQRPSTWPLEITD